MKQILVLFILLLVSCKADKKTDSIKGNENLVEKSIVDDIELEILDYDRLEPYLINNDDKTYVVNFWATWCAPCIKELPHFEMLNANYKSKNVEVLLVSLDFPSAI